MPQLARLPFVPLCVVESLFQSVKSTLQRLLYTLLPPPLALSTDLSVWLLTQLATLHVLSGQKELHPQISLSQKLFYIAAVTDSGPHSNFASPNAAVRDAGIWLNYNNQTPQLFCLALNFYKTWVCVECCYVSSTRLTSAMEPFSTNLMMGTRFFSSRVKP